MTKKLSDQEKKKRKAERRKSNQQKAPSTTSTHVQIDPKAEGVPTEEPANLCDTCAFEYGECDGVPKFGEEELADNVVECPTWDNVEDFPTVDQKPVISEDQIAAVSLGDPNTALMGLNDVVIVCSGGCGKTTEGMTHENASGIFTKGICDAGKWTTLPDWTCQECIDAAHDGDDNPPKEPEPETTRADLPDRPDPKRFLEDKTDRGACPGCERPLKRTAYNRYRDAIRCTNPRCGQYRAVVKTVGTGVN